MVEKNLKGDSADRRLDAAVELAQLTEYPVFGLTAKPWPDARFRDLFGSKDATIVRLFDNPPALRRAGFNLEHDGNSRIVTGDLRRALIPGWKIMELWRDGALIYAVDAFVQPLWGSPRSDGSIEFNPLALAEPVYLFAELSRLIYEQSAQDLKSIEYRIRFDRLIRDGKRATLGVGQLGPFFFGGPEQRPAPYSNMDKASLWERKDINSGRVAYELIREVYNWFGIHNNGIPYTGKDPNGETVIDPEALKKAGETVSR